MPDVIVIGSGFGGAAAATRLVEAGLSVTMIERGPWRDTLPVRSMGLSARAPFPRGRRALLDLVRNLNLPFLPVGRLTFNRRGLFDIHLGRGLNVICSSGVGGGSHVYAGLNLAPPDPEWWDGVASGLSTTELESSYGRIFERMGSRAPMADDQLPNTLAERFGTESILDTQGADYELTMGLAFPETPGAPRRITTADGVERMEAVPGEEGNLGSEGGGKTTLDFAFLAGAMKRGLAVLDQCEVTVVRRHGEAYTVEFRNHHNGKDETLEAKRVVIAAGTMNTLRVLLASTAAGALAPMRGLGERFGGNGDYFGYWKLDDAERDLSASYPAHGPVRLRETDEVAPGDWPMIVEGALPTPKALPLGRWVSRMLTHRRQLWRACRHAVCRVSGNPVSTGQVPDDPDIHRCFRRNRFAVGPDIPALGAADF